MKQVWTEPVTQLSMRYWFSDVWLARYAESMIYLVRPGANGLGLS